MFIDAQTPTPAQLDRMAEITTDDVERAARAFRRAVLVTRGGARFLLDASTSGDAGPARGPIPDDEG